MASKTKKQISGAFKQYVVRHIKEGYVAVPHREVWCIYYDDCLDKAVSDKLATWSCGDCGKVVRRKYVTAPATAWPSCQNPSEAMLPIDFQD